MRIRKLALFAIWKVSSAILSPIGRKIPAWLRQSSAGAQPWLLTGCYVPSQTFSNFLRLWNRNWVCKVRMSLHASSFPFSLAHSHARARCHWDLKNSWTQWTMGPCLGHQQLQGQGQGSSSRSTWWEHPGLLGAADTHDGATAPLRFLPFSLIIFVN